MKDISLHILDIVHNATRAQATKITINLDEDTDENRYVLRIEDNGKGIDPKMLPEIFDPWTTSRKTRKVGMGLPLLKHNAMQAGGDLIVTSVPGTGTKIEAEFEHQHIDRPPAGDLAGIVIQLLSSFPDIHFTYIHKARGGMFKIDSEEIRETLDGVSLNEPEIRNYIREMISENLQAIGAEH